MSLIEFYKYQGTGNDFIIIDDRRKTFSKNDTKFINRLCNRRFGIGADGMILLQDDDASDFRMVYFNSDGRESTMCGNGGRCVVAFAKAKNIINTTATFEAIDGRHEAEILTDGRISLGMKAVKTLQVFSGHVFLDTGSPHHVELTDNVDHIDVAEEGAYLRKKYGDNGANVNFVQPLGNDSFKVRTYERGVEAETLSCGTGVTAVALAMHKTGQVDAQIVTLHTPGGVLEVSFDSYGQGYQNIRLTGPATYVFTGEVNHEI